MIDFWADFSILFRLLATEHAMSNSREWVHICTQHNLRSRAFWASFSLFIIKFRSCRLRCLAEALDPEGADGWKSSLVCFGGNGAGGRKSSSLILDSCKESW